MAVLQAHVTARRPLSLLANSEVLVALGVVGVLTIMMIPLPPLMLDMFLAFNMTLALLVLLLTIYAGRPLEFSIFPSLLLITTLFRLSLNVASTRLVLLHGHTGSGAAGMVIKSFGSFMVGGNPTVGLVVFIILVVVNFVVITRGSGRIAEVAARFTLDAMPGKQMSIDADLNAGLVDESEAKRRRAEIAKEADFYGAMDGASKFVRGDAIAGVLITLINIVGGLVIGVFQQDLDVHTAMQNYTLLTIGDGLVSQIPALIISTGAGILVSRAAGEGDMGTDFARHFGSQPRALALASGVVAVVGLLPGLPLVPFTSLAAVLAFLAYRARQAMIRTAQQPEADVEPRRPHGPEPVESLLPLDPLELEVGYGLIPLVDEEQQGELLDRIRLIRRQFALEMGLVVPPLHVRDNLQLKPGEYAICIRGNEVARGELMPDHFLAMEPGDVKRRVEGIPTVEPAFQLPALWISSSKKEEAQIAGYTVADPASVVATHLSETISRHADELLGRQDVQNLLDNLSKRYPRVVEELTPGLLSLGQVQKVLQNLVRERVCIRDLLTIVETLADYAVVTKDPDLLTEYVRQRLARAIIKPYLRADKKLSVIVVGAEVEEAITASVRETEHGTYLAMEPSTVDRINRCLKRVLDRLPPQASAPLLLASPRIRRHLRRLCERFHPDLAVLSDSEVVGDAKIAVVDTLELSNAH
jgi:flagellar biosynthesis protein FlhA